MSNEHFYPGVAHIMVSITYWFKRNVARRKLEVGSKICCDLQHKQCKITEDNDIQSKLVFHK